MRHVELRAFLRVLAPALTWLAAVNAIAGPAPKAEIAPTIPHAQIIYSVAFDSDGSHLASADGDGIVKVWDARTRQLLRTFEKELYGINAIAFSPSGKEIVVAGQDSWAMKLVDAATGTRVRMFSGHRIEILCAAFSPGGKRIASGDRNGHAMIWDPASGARLLELTGHSKGVYGLAFTPDGNQLVTESFDKSLRVWDAATGKLVRTLTGNPSLQYLKTLVGFGPERDEDIFWAIAVSPDGKLSHWLCGSQRRYGVNMICILIICNFGRTNPG